MGGIPEGVKPEGVKINPEDLRSQYAPKKGAESNDDKISGFKELEESFEAKEDEPMKRFLDLIGDYIDLKLLETFSEQEKNVIKLAIFSEVEGELGFGNSIGRIIEDLIVPIKNMLNDFNNGIIDKNNLQQEFNEYSSIFEKIGLNSVQEKIDEKIEKVNAAKKESSDNNFKSLNSVLDIFNPKREQESETVLFDKIKNKTKNIARQLRAGREVGEDISDLLGSMPFGDDITGWLSNKIKEGGFLGLILNLIFGENFEFNIKAKKSIKNLYEFYKKETSPFKGTDISQEDLKKLTPKKLEAFYKFLDNKKIDYEDDSFWEELFTGKGDSDKIKKLHNLLQNKDGSILGKDDGLEQLLEKLNGVGEVYNKRDNIDQQEGIARTKRDLEAAKKAAKAAAVGTTAEGTKVKGDTTEGTTAEGGDTTEGTTAASDRVKELERTLQEQEFKMSLTNIGTKHEINFEGNIYSVGFKDNILTLGGKEYKLSLLATEHNNMQVLQSIGFNGNFITAKYRTGLFSSETLDLEKSLMSDIFTSLIHNGGYEKKIDGKPAELVITPVGEKSS